MSNCVSRFDYGKYSGGRKITIRLSDEQYDYVCENALKMGISASEFVRLLLEVNIMKTMKAQKIKGVIDNAHIKTGKHYKL